MPVKSVTAAQVLSPGPGSPVSLWRWLARLPDPRDRRGVRFTLACVIAVAIAARLAGCDSFTAIGEWAASRPQRVLKALGCPLSKRAGVYIAPSEKTVRRVAGPAGIDHDLAGDLLCGWTAELAAACEIFSPAQLQQQRRDAARTAKAQARKAREKAREAEKKARKAARRDQAARVRAEEKARKAGRQARRAAAAAAALRACLPALRAFSSALTRAAWSRLAALRAFFSASRAFSLALRAWAFAVRAASRRCCCSCAGEKISHAAASSAVHPHSRSPARSWSMPAGPATRRTVFSDGAI